MLNQEAHAKLQAHRQVVEAAAPESEPAKPTAPPAVLRRGDTESKIVFTSRALNYASAASSVERHSSAAAFERHTSAAAFPYFPPSRLHVAATTGDINQAAYTTPRRGAPVKSPHYYVDGEEDQELYYQEERQEYEW